MMKVSNMKVKLISLILTLAMGVSILVGCGSGQEGSTDNGKTTANEQTVTTGNDQPSSTNTANTTTEKKKIYIIQENADEIRDTNQKSILSYLDKAGYTSQTAEITEMKMLGDEKKAPEVVESIKSAKPDVVILNGSNMVFTAIAKPLNGTGIPVIVPSNVNGKDFNFVDAAGKPTQNVTGLYSLPKDMQLKCFELLQKINPLNGKKVVIISVAGRFTKEDLERDLKAVGAELKDFVEIKFVEEFQEAFLKYNDDPEVGWLLPGVWSVQKKDGTATTVPEVAKWEVSNRKKPDGSFYEAAVKMGMLAGLGVNLPAAAEQQTEMAVKILKGEKVTNLIAEYPKKTRIVINKKTADTMNITIPAELLGSATVYTQLVTDSDYK